MFTVREHLFKLNIGIDVKLSKAYVHIYYTFTDREHSKMVNTWTI